jgi:hypothetical protein
LKYPREMPDRSFDPVVDKLGGCSVEGPLRYSWDQGKQLDPLSFNIARRKDGCHKECYTTVIFTLPQPSGPGDQAALSKSEIMLGLEA